jgi:hypothetical protein
MKVEQPKKVDETPTPAHKQIEQPKPQIGDEEE